MTNVTRDAAAEALRQRLETEAANRAAAAAGAESPTGDAGEPAAAAGAESPTGDTGETSEPVTAAPPVAVSYANVILAALPQDNGSFSCMVFPDKATATAKMDVAAFKANGGRFFAAKEIVPKVKVTL